MKTVDVVKLVLGVGIELVTLARTIQTASELDDSELDAAIAEAEQRSQTALRELREVTKAGA